MACSSGKPYIATGKDAQRILAMKPKKEIVEMHKRHAALGGGFQFCSKVENNEDRKDKRPDFLDNMHPNQDPFIEGCIPMIYAIE